MKRSNKSNILYWLKGEDTQNFGDFLSEYLVSRLFFGYRADVSGVHIIGSVMDDMFVPLRAQSGHPVVFWGCGIREAGGLSREKWPAVEIQAVRGPLSASELELGAFAPQGDPAFLLPALYRPQKLDWLAGKSICVPHFHDKRDDRTLLAASGCDVVVRPNIENNEKALTDVIDAIFSADFVLGSAMHACLVAAAYRRPFAYWRADTIDLPFKWQDISQSLNIPCEFVAGIDEARRHYDTVIAPSIRLPSLLPSLLRAPLLVRASGLIDVLRWHQEERADAGTSPTALDDAQALADFATQQQRLFDGILEELRTSQQRLRELERLPGQSSDHQRSLLGRVLFRRDGKPARGLRRILFHNNGKPRRIFRSWVIRQGVPTPPFRQWMESEDYLALPKAHRRPSSPPPFTLVPSAFGPSTAPAAPSDRTLAGKLTPEGRRCVLIIDSVYPTPDRDSGSLDAINFVRIFQRMGYSVYFVAKSHFQSKALNEIARAAKESLERTGAIAVDDTYASSIFDFIRANGSLFELVFLSRVHHGGQFFETVRAHSRHSKIIFNTVDLHYVRQRREGSLEGNRAKIDEALHTRERELDLIRLADAAIVVSDEELKLLEEEVPGAPVYEVRLIRDVPGRRADFAARRHIGFIGGYRHLPNLDGVRHFLDSIWPLVLRELPDAQFHLMGADMPDDLRRRTDRGLVFIGHVADLRETFEALRLTVAPLRYGAGTKGKVISSLCHGVPCICTSIAAEGMRLYEDGGILVADDPAEFAKLVVRAYRDEELWQRLSDSGLRRMRERHSFDTGVARMKTIVQGLGLAPPPPP
ncbi:glycosyltransferase [Ancylobacter rudongensis]|uniref:Glycosyl transferases group 1 n=1 Tax=Ancylobacter rudongensis TaxID=177413 RepID=A0A1G4UFC5_9HYPH|nr:glycosyltransferase [Ancylobacter rudongensis]SCW92342.1 Glycosyl transferases group 1 [Ancylobacter rudongensis]